MKRRLHIIIISILAIVIVSTAFIPLTNKVKKEKEKRTNVVKIHPEAGYIEEIGD